jgi:RNA polymerase sigma factor (sigma-70 family)
VSYSTGEAPVRSLSGPRGGSLGEFELLYRTQVATVTGFFARRTRDPQLVADLTADTFVQAARSFVSHGPADGSERPWLLAIARRVYAKHCEHTTRRRDAARRDMARQLLDEDETEQLMERIDAQRSARELLESLAGLSDLDRQAVESVDLGDLTPKQAAAALGISPGALRVRLFRARAKLRKESRKHV